MLEKNADALKNQPSLLIDLNERSSRIIGKVQLLAIPMTTRHCYISLHETLNLRLPGESTGDWHFLSTFYSPANQPPVEARRAGVGQDVDTTSSLGSLGVRDMSAILVEKGILARRNGPVWVANHVRAIADCALLALRSIHQPYAVTVDDVNQWLDTRSQIDDLVTNYLMPLRQQKKGRELAKWDAWLKTIHYT